MSNAFSRARRFALAGTALLLAGALFRAQVAQALVIRGDDYLYRGDSRAALVRYRRAIALSPLSQTAVDRYVFVNMERHTSGALDVAIAAANRYLESRPHDAMLLSDRALCYLSEHQYRAAERDFEAAAKAARAPADYVFAGWAARRDGHKQHARLLWQAALRITPRYVPALAALRREGY